MGIEDRREREREELRRKILDAAAELFAREGVKQVSMRRIARRIEYSPTTIYSHFANKAELVRRLSDDVFARLIERLERETKEATDPLDGLIRGCRAYIRFGLEYPDFYIVTFVESGGNRVDGPEIEFEGSTGQQAFQCLETAVKNAMESGQIPRDRNAKTVACLCWAAMHGLTAVLISRRRFPWSDQEQLIEGMLRSALPQRIAPS